ncbi:ABC transporter ATP-binding protein [Caenimonas terrae]|uniref:ABC transporter ATP-binding protein n=1 Tax=Caenimonas terrae TaxID=696074 RepID=A0ABW0NEN2_9BURK
MNSPRRPLLVGAAALLVGLLPPSSAHADEEGWTSLFAPGHTTLELQASPYTYHFSRQPHSHVSLLGLTSVRDSGWLWGGAYFRNSFGQPSAYLYAGRRYDEPFGLQRVYWNWSAGLIYGYKPPYQDKVPVNWHGIAPAIVPAIGYRVTPGISAELSLLGTSALMLQFVVALDGKHGLASSF